VFSLNREVSVTTDVRDRKADKGQKAKKVDTGLSIVDKLLSIFSSARSIEHDRHTAGSDGDHDAKANKGDKGDKGDKGSKW
jgi:hypothetical protein